MDSTWGILVDVSVAGPYDEGVGGKTVSCRETILISLERKFKYVSNVKRLLDKQPPW